MAFFTASARSWTTLSAALMLSACASTPGPHLVTARSSPATSQDIEWVQTTLMQGNTKSAENQIKVLLKRDPLNPRLLLLSESLKGDFSWRDITVL